MIQMHLLLGNTSNSATSAAIIKGGFTKFPERIKVLRDLSVSHRRNQVFKPGALLQLHVLTLGRDTTTI